MNKTIDISLAGLLFHLEESAYYKLKNYLQHVRNSLNAEEDIDEIMNEVEARIAELLLQKQNHPNEVVNEKQIEEIIEVIGKPEEFEEEEKESGFSHRIKKRLFRDPEHAMIGGVAAGFAHYLGIDITLMRILFIILLFVTKGGFLLIYLLLWMIIPKARTVTDKLKMKGEEVSLDNIVENVSNEPLKTNNKALGENIERVGAGVGEVLLKLIGLFLAFISGIVILGLIISALAISPMSDFSMVINNDTAVLQQIGMPLMWLNVLVLLLVGIPFVLLFVLGLKLLFPHIKTLSRNILLILGTIWIISFIVLTVKSISGLAHKTFNTDVKETFAFTSSKDTLFIKTQSLSDSIINNQYTDDDISLYFKASPDQKFHLILIKNAEGINYKEAKKTAQEMEYPVSIDSLTGKIILPDEFLYPSKRVYSDYDLELVLKIPEGKFVKVTDLDSSIFYSIHCNDDGVIYNQNGKIKCSTHDEDMESDDNDEDEKIEIKGDNMHISIDEDGVKIKAKDKNGKKAMIKIDEDGVNIEKR